MSLNCFIKLPKEVQILIWEYDPTYREIYSKGVVGDINVMISKRLASQYYNGRSQDFTKTSFRFYQMKRWFTAHFEEIEYNKFQMYLWDEKHGTRSAHFHYIY